jgi:hypothetical protein
VANGLFEAYSWCECDAMRVNTNPISIEVGLIPSSSQRGPTHARHRARLVIFVPDGGESVFRKASQALAVPFCLCHI